MEAANLTGNNALTGELVAAYDRIPGAASCKARTQAPTSTPPSVKHGRTQ
jgi:hypothetical protein